MGTDRTITCISSVMYFFTLALLLLSFNGVYMAKASPQNFEERYLSLIEDREDGNIYTVEDSNQEANASNAEERQSCSDAFGGCQAAWCFFIHMRLGYCRRTCGTCTPLSPTAPTIG